jgi:RNA polymerase sigma-70 factor (ECF subfamily)
VIAEPVPETQSYQHLKRYLFAVAYRMTGSATDAEDLVHDAWVRYLDAGSPDVGSLKGWLTTAVTRLALDHLKSARVRREQYIGPWMAEPVPTADVLGDPAATVEQRESVSLAFLTLLERLTPGQRVVYVLREALGLPYEEIAGHVGSTAVACRQSYQRAQRSLGEDRRPSVAPADEHRQLIERFVAAVQSGDAASIAALLAEDVVLVGDGGPTRLTNRRPVFGPDRVSRGLAGQARKLMAEMRPYAFMFADLNGATAIVVHEGRRIDRVFAIDSDQGWITGVRGMLNPDKLRYLERALFG